MGAGSDGGAGLYRRGKGKGRCSFAAGTSNLVEYLRCSAFPFQDAPEQHVTSTGPPDWEIEGFISSHFVIRESVLRCHGGSPEKCLIRTDQPIVTFLLVQDMGHSKCLISPENYYIRSSKRNTPVASKLAHPTNQLDTNKQANKPTRQDHQNDLVV